jgi:hypothetical protein
MWQDISNRWLYTPLHNSLLISDVIIFSGRRKSLLSGYHRQQIVLEKNKYFVKIINKKIKTKLERKDYEVLWKTTKSLKLRNGILFF